MLLQHRVLLLHKELYCYVRVFLQLLAKKLFEQHYKEWNLFGNFHHHILLFCFRLNHKYQLLHIRSMLSFKTQRYENNLLAVNPLFLF